MKINMRMYTVACMLLSGCGDACYGRSVTGRATSVGSRLSTDATGNNIEKIAVRLDDAIADSKTREVAGGKGDSIDIECLSTRCAGLVVGDCAAFTCMHVVTGCGSPDVMQCKLLKVTDCK